MVENMRKKRHVDDLNTNSALPNPDRQVQKTNTGEEPSKKNHKSQVGGCQRQMGPPDHRPKRRAHDFFEHGMLLDKGRQGRAGKIVAADQELPRQVREQKLVPEVT